MKEFQSELAALISKHNIDIESGVPKYMLAELLCRIIESIGKPAKEIRIGWHEGDSVCGQKPIEDDIL